MHLVFTDIDGTLLDHNTYSYEMSLKGMSILKEKNIPLVLVSSKTFDEMKLLHEKLLLDSPFVFENGGGISNYEEGQYNFDIIGMPIDELIHMRSLISEVMKCEIKLLTEMTTEEIVDLTGLTEDRAKLAAMRKASLPFILVENRKIDVNYLNEINEKIRSNNIFITKGGRFFHCSSIEANKGKAMKKIVDIYNSKFRQNKIITVAIGDSENDIPMLKSVDFPFLVRKHDGSMIETGIDNVKVTEGVGPAGFTEAMKEVFG